MEKLINSFSNVRKITVDMWRSCQADSYDQALKDGAVRTIVSGDPNELITMLKAAGMTADMIEDNSPENSIKLKFQVDDLVIMNEYPLANWRQFFIDYEAGKAQYFFGA
jgi:hypothetical protein